MELLPLFVPLCAALLLGSSVWNRARGRRLVGAPTRSIDGRVVTVAPMATPFSVWLRLELPTMLTARELRQRRGLDAVRDARARLFGVARLAHLEIGGGRAHLVVRPRGHTEPGLTLTCQRALELVVALERSRAAVDAEGPPAGTPIAVPATGGGPADSGTRATRT